MRIGTARRGAAALLAAALGAGLAAPAAAITVYVRAAPITTGLEATMPDGTVVPMWGYRVGPTRANVTNLANLPQSPGAAIRVPAGDTTLTVVLINNLPVPTSFVLHGHNTTMTPVFATAAGVVCTPPAAGAPAADMTALQAFRDCRMRSFTREAPPRPLADNVNAANDVVYTYTNVRPGTYLYQSGTMSQVQVQMGLYGMVRKDAPPPAPLPGNNAYPNVTYDNDVALLLSEVDPAVHTAVAAGTFSTSTLAYDPRYFRLHRYNPTTGACATATPGPCIAQPIEFTERTIAIAGPPALPARGTLTIQPGERQLVRVANAGIQSRSLMLIDGHWFLVAEDGLAFPYPREQYSAFLPAAKTADLWFTPTLAGGETAAIDRQLAIFDRRLALTNNNADPGGGQLIRLNVANAGVAPAVDVSNCGTTGTEDAPYACIVTGTVAGGATLSYALDAAPAGMTIDPASGAIGWTPDNAQAWKPLVGQTATNPVQVRVTASTGRYTTGVFSVVVANVNDAPVAANDAYNVRGGALAAPVSVLANDADPDGDPIGAITVVAAPANGTLTMNANGTFNYTAGSLPASGSSTDTFTYTVTDGTLASNAATVTLTVYANSAPTAVDDVDARAFAAVGPSFIDVLVNDYDVDGNLAPPTLAIVGPPNRGGTAAVVTAGCPVAGRPCISYTPPAAFRGTEAITYRVGDTLGALSASATLRVNVQ
jgi:VCBS repeat-containing protein